MPSNGYGHSGGWVTFNVPAGVQWVDVVCDGAGSGSRPGGRVTGRIQVNPNQSLKILVGEAGKGGGSHNGGAVTTGGGGAGGDSNGASAGNSGGGGTFIRRNTTDGQNICIAGGAGGTSGDSGDGGQGGGPVGAAGGRGTSGSNATGNATGGTQTQGGNGGTSSSGGGFDGANAANSVGARGGKGGDPGGNYGHGGGGGGGGYRAGGGGQASSRGFAPGGGGGGGSSYVGGLVSPNNNQGGAGVGDGHVTLTWVNAPPANQPPTPPSNVRIDGKPESNAMATKSVGRVEVEAELNDPDNDNVQMLVRYSKSQSFATSQDAPMSQFIHSGNRVGVTLTGLDQDTRYWLHLYAKDEHDKWSNFNSANFWTNRRPTAPTLLTPSDNVSISALSSISFHWSHNDPDPNDPQQGYELRWRTASSSTKPSGDWRTITRAGDSTTTYVTNPGEFKSSTFYEWSVRTRDQQGRWGDWANARSFYSSGVSAPPIPTAPVSGVGTDASAVIRFKWKFIDPAPGEAQTKADLRWRIVGQDDFSWITHLGAVTPGEPGGDKFWDIPEDVFSFPGYHYEWQVRTYNTGSPSIASDWSDSATFWTIGTPGSEVDRPPPDTTTIQGALGCGSYRVFVYDQGGQVLRGEIEPITTLMFKRLRDDISNCLVTTNGFGEDCGQLLKEVRSWMHELVVYRDDVRVWEGPITRITYTQDSVQFEAKDVMAYVYRRIMRQGYNDSYREVDGEELGIESVIYRAQQIIVNALAPSDPNVLPYLTAITSDDDPHESRVVPDYSTTAWEQVDDLAATAGIDYTVVGRRILIWDTHLAIGRLPEMRDGDFSDPPVVTEYGMQLSNYSAVTNNTGVWGAARPHDEDDNYEFYGPIEMLASAYGESSTAGGEVVLTRRAREKLEGAFREQAARNISGRWPTPLVVRVPDNSTLNPEVGIGFDQLVPGVWIPLRSSGTLRDVAQWQKLDSVTVNFVRAVEQIQVVMSPAPHGGDDPDLNVDPGIDA